MKTKKIVKTALKSLMPAEKLKLDFGCGPHKREGFKGVDQFEFVGVDYVFDIAKGKWPFADNSVEEANASHFVEHLTAKERAVFMNELYRVMVPGAKFHMVVPHWNSNRAYGDMTHQWPPVSEMWFYYLSKEWRMQQAPHTDQSVNPEGYTCNFEATWGYSMRGDLPTRNEEFRQFALSNYKEAAQDIIATLVKPLEVKKA